VKRGSSLSESGYPGFCTADFPLVRSCSLWWIVLVYGLVQKRFNIDIPSLRIIQ
jgi:hypothetical protein